VEEGEGDWKMAAMLGAFFGWEPLLLVLLLASAAGAVVGVGAILLRRGEWHSRLPFGTFLGVAAMLVLFGGDRLLAAYHGLFRG
jgi:leader peptidase (prepilin peptidase)/N-methyltransferase